MRLAAALLVTAGFAVAPVLFDERVATWSDLVPREGLTATSSTRADTSRFAIDEAPQTVWSGRCEPGDWLRIELGRVVPVTAVVVDNGQIQENYPRGLDVAPVATDGMGRRDVLEPAGRRFRTWQTFRADEPAPARAVVIRLPLNRADWSASGRWDVRDVRVLTSERRAFDVAAWVGALRASVVPWICALAFAWFAAGGRGARARPGKELG